MVWAQCRVAFVYYLETKRPDNNVHVHLQA